MREKEEPKKEDNYWKYLIIFISALFIAITLMTLNSTWTDAIDKDYLSKLTPEERQEIFTERETQKQKQIDEQNKRAKESSEFMISIIPYLMILGVGIVIGNMFRW